MFELNLLSNNYKCIDDFAENDQRLQLTYLAHKKTY